MCNQLSIHQVASAYSEALDALLDAYEEIGNNLPLLSQYQDLSEHARVSHNPHFQRALILIYTDILEFHKKALKYFQQRSRLGTSYLNPTPAEMDFSVETTISGYLEDIQNPIFRVGGKHSSQSAPCGTPSEFSPIQTVEGSEPSPLRATISRVADGKTEGGSRESKLGNCREISTIGHSQSVALCRSYRLRLRNFLMQAKELSGKWTLAG